MNTYDEEHALSKAIREFDEMKRLTQAAEKIKSNADAGKMVKEYIMAQMKSDYAKLAGQETNSLPELRSVIEAQGVGATIPVTVSRNGEQFDVQVKLSEVPNE